MTPKKPNEYIKHPARYRLEVMYINNKPVFACLGHDDFPVLRYERGYGGYPIEDINISFTQKYSMQIRAWNMGKDEAIRAISDVMCYINATPDRQASMHKPYMLVDREDQSICDRSNKEFEDKLIEYIANDLPPEDVFVPDVAEFIIHQRWRRDNIK